MRDVNQELLVLKNHSCFCIAWAWIDDEVRLSASLLMDFLGQFPANFFFNLCHSRSNQAKTFRENESKV